MSGFFIKLGAVTVTIVALYYLMSPYQECMRTQESYEDYVTDFWNRRGGYTATREEFRGFKVIHCQGRTSW